jgi:tRNA U34 5-methylaminomethyl-2-thiouridine-forming methyltransferase MnmC
MANIEIIITSDGSHSLRDTRLNETYHSIHGAVQESVHVFIKNGLVFFENRDHPIEIRILEVGFGTGLNALLTLRHVMGVRLQIHYTTLEAFPITEETIPLLNYPEILDFAGAASLFRKLHTASWAQEEAILNNFTLKKQLGRLQDSAWSDEQFDLVFFDAFAPVKQPELWEMELLRKVEQSMKPGAVFVTYCAKGQLKRDLRSLGLQVETLPGPPGKKEMVRAMKIVTSQADKLRR